MSLTLEQIIAYNQKKSSYRRNWLAKRHACNPYCYFCDLETFFDMDANTKKKTSDLMRHATIDHDVPVSRGGIDNMTNWKLSCATCNEIKADMTGREYIEFLKNEGVL